MQKVRGFRQVVFVAGFEDVVPGAQETLLDVAGVGRLTAECVLVLGAGAPLGASLRWTSLAPGTESTVLTVLHQGSDPVVLGGTTDLEEVTQALVGASTSADTGTDVRLQLAGPVVGIVEAAVVTKPGGAQSCRAAASLTVSP